MNIAIVGATGMVGRTFLKLLEDKKFPFQTLKLFSSPKNKGKQIKVNGQSWSVQSLEPGCFKDLDVVFFSAGESISRKWAESATSQGAFVIDNSSAFRMQKGVPLVVPEINAHLIRDKKTKIIIANPNCSTIQLTLALQPLHSCFGLESVNVASYQSLSGAGQKAVDRLKTESLEVLNNEKKPASLLDFYAFNCIPQIGSLDENGFSTEENKIMNETKKILNLPDLLINATAVRVPCFNGHGEVVQVRLKKAPHNSSEVLEALKAQKGLAAAEILPHQAFVDGKDDVFVSRVRPAPGCSNKEWLFWLCADNLKKGAALNSLQIVEHLMKF